MTEIQRRTLLGEVETTIAALELSDEDAALAELARKYAHQIDIAAVIRARADQAVKDARERAADYGEDSSEYDLLERVTALAQKLAERDTIDRLGRNLLAALDALQASPAARAKAGKAVDKPRESNPTPGKLFELRSRQAK